MPNNVKRRPDKRREREREGKRQKDHELIREQNKNAFEYFGERETTRSVVD